MATLKKFVCENCNESIDAGVLFEALTYIADQEKKCNKCGQIMSLQLAFDFGLGVGEVPYKVLGVFYPEDFESLNWENDDESNVTYWPLLIVISNTINNIKSYWLPYWHEVKYPNGKNNYKYGQWAPVIDIKTFNSLLHQARSKGLLF